MHLRVLHSQVQPRKYMIFMANFSLIDRKLWLLYGGHSDQLRTMNGQIFIALFGSNDASCKLYEWKNNRMKACLCSFPALLILTRENINLNRVPQVIHEASCHTSHSCRGLDNAFSLETIPVSLRMPVLKKNPSCFPTASYSLEFELITIACICAISRHSWSGLTSQFRTLVNIKIMCLCRAWGKDGSFWKIVHFTHCFCFAVDIENVTNQYMPVNSIA